MTENTVDPSGFTVSHLNEEDFKQGGLRSFAKYRDLGIGAATFGFAGAQVVRIVEPCSDDVRKRHYHTTQFQLIYQLKGWTEIEFEGQGVHLMKEGSVWIQPFGIAHTVLDYEVGSEILEVTLPAEFQTQPTA